jgi:hypothetical protein
MSLLGLLGGFEAIFNPQILRALFHFLCGLGIERRASQMLSTHSTTEVHPQPLPLTTTTTAGRSKS